MNLQTKKYFSSRRLIFGFCLLFSLNLQADNPVYSTNPFSFRIDVEYDDMQENFFVVDVDNDGLVDYTFRSKNKLYVYSHAGIKLWESEIALPGYNNGAKYGAADFDNDGQVEIAALDTNNRIIIYNARNGNIEHTFSLTTTDMTSFCGHIAIANIRGLGDRDAIIQTVDIIPPHHGWESYVNRSVFAVNLENGQEIWAQRILQDRDQNNPVSGPGGFYEGYWGQAHGPFFCADIDNDGKDEVIGGNLIDDDGTLIDLSYPNEWVSALISPHPDQKHKELVDHLDAIGLGDLRPDIAGLEWIMTEEDHLGGSEAWNTTLISKQAPDNIVWRKETRIFPNTSKREPQNVAVGNFDTTKAFSEIWLRSRLGNSTETQHPWIFEGSGYEFSDYQSITTLPAGFNPIGNGFGLEMIWTIDWTGYKKEYIVGQARHTNGNVGIFDAVTGAAIWYTGREHLAVKSHFVYVADVAGDNREEVIICDSTRTGLYIRVYQNRTENNAQSKPPKWQDPLYRRVKQNWNYYSPGSYTTPDFPVISQISVTGIESNGFIVLWKTDLPADSQLEYGKTSSYGTHTNLDTNLTLSHADTITGLSPDTEYHFRIKSNSKWKISGISHDAAATTDFNKKLAIVSPALSIYAGTISPLMTIQLQNIQGQARTASTDITVQISSSSSNGSFSLAKSNWLEITEVTIPAGSNSTSFYYRDQSAGHPTISLQEIPSRDWARLNQQQYIKQNGSRHQAHRLQGSVKLSSGQQPSTESFHIRAFMNNQPSQILTETSSACGYAAGQWFIECANFPNGWSTGATITLAFIDAAYHEKDTLEVILTGTNPQNTAESILGIDPPWITALAVTGSNKLQITWNDMPSILGYNVYRSSKAPFTADKAGGSNRIASMVHDQDNNTSGVQWTDNSSPVGNTESNAFYIITAINQNQESRGSKTIGEVDYALITTAGTDFNMICLPLRSLSPHINTASDLQNQISSCTSVSRWSAANQGFSQYVPGIPSSNFSVNAPNPYGLTVNSNTIYTMLGEYVEPLYELKTTSGTDFNYISLPLSMQNGSNAATLMSTISGANSIAVWSNNGQSYQQYIAELPGSNFNLAPGQPFIVNVTRNSFWPETSAAKTIAPAPSFRQTSAGSGSPHAVYGKLILSDPKIAETLILTAYLESNPHKILTGKSPGCLFEQDYWLIQCSSFSSSWNPGDLLHIQIETADYSLKVEQTVTLSRFPADKASDFAIDKNLTKPLSFTLKQNFPNPFNSETLISYSLPKETQLTLRIYNVQGRLVNTLLETRVKSGTYKTSWNGRDSQGRAMSSGVYFILLQGNGKIDRKKILLIR